MSNRCRLGFLVIILGALAWEDGAYAIPCGIAVPCPSDVFQITDANGNIVNDINGDPVNYTFTEVSESTVSTVAPQIFIGSGVVGGAVYLTEGPPALTGLTQVSDVITAGTVLDADGVDKDVVFTFQSDGQTVPLSYVDCTAVTCVAETGTQTGQQPQDLSSFFTMSGVSLHVLVQSDVEALTPPGIFWMNTEQQLPGGPPRFETLGGARLDGTFVNQSFVTPQAGNVNYTSFLGVAFDGTYIYWANPNSIGRSTLDRQNVNQNFISGVLPGAGIAVDANYIYWTTGDSSDSTFGTTIGRAKRDGTLLDVNFITGLNRPNGLAVDANYIYWTNNGGPLTIGRANRDGTGVNQNFITGIARCAAGIAVDANYIYWGDCIANAIGRAKRDGTGVNQNFITSVGPPAGVAVDANYIYWGTTAGEEIGRANRDGTGVNNDFITTSSGNGHAEPSGVAVTLDTDGDGIADLFDNCPYTPNGPSLGTCLGDFPQGQATCHANSDCTSGQCSLNQEDTGGIGTGSPPDGIGDACQCGDVNNDGFVTGTDAVLINRAIASLSPYTSVTLLPGFSKCDVIDTSGKCTVTDAVVINRAVAALAPGVKQTCTAAIPH